MSSSVVFFSLFLGFFLGFIHFIGEGLNIPQGTRHYHIISFASGISIGYLFLDLLPHTYDAAEHLRGGVFFFLLMGFAFVHLVEKYFYQHAEATKLKHEFKTVHSITFFIYYFLAGFVVVELVQQSLLEGILFVFPVSIHAGLSSASLSEIHGRFKPTLWERLLLSLATPTGVLAAFTIHLPPVLQNITISGIAGVLLYVFVKEFLPEKEKGQPLLFILGLLVFFILNYFTRLLIA